MAHDDMHVVMYKILAYLYDCMRRGIEPQRGEIAHDGMCGIPYPYWEAIMRELSERGYVRGVSFAKDGVFMASPTITMEGVEFLKDNSMMKKALRFLKEARSTIPFV